MNIQRRKLDGKGLIIGNETVDKVSLAQEGDSVFMSAKERFDDSFISKFESLLPEGIELVKNLFKPCSNGNFRTFIGDSDYQPAETKME